ncbi:CYTH domain-containing protein [Frigoribacterium endophyticum]|uniref:CYTH domain-containing protein n=1 Tax=Frigoribacterium endophyticum TaxID=1522176 RepID=UPI001421F0BB|nr:CYTH domain-containing protein [Frigoribacterium endophyticum]NII51118.1 inorganic triphosphatase YgiF [Frigoribacterium endophyticum]
MTGTEQIEIERKYDVDDEAAVPDLVGVGVGAGAGAGGGAGRALEVARVELDPAASLSATYHDTPDHRLLGARVTLRRRTGGHDAGWHLKLPPEVAGGGRREVHHPLGADDEPVPAELLDRVAALLGTGGGGDGVGDGAPALRPVLLLETRRTAHHLLDHEGRELVEVADDVVRATRAADGRVRAWREWEAELGRGVDGPEGDALLDAVAPRLHAAGARPSAHRSKLALGLGD